jgi:hypothetical protein
MDYHFTTSLPRGCVPDVMDLLGLRRDDVTVAKPSPKCSSGPCGSKWMRRAKRCTDHSNTNLSWRDGMWRPNPPTSSPVNSMQNLYRALARDEACNQSIVDDVLAVLQEGRSPASAALWSRSG